MVWKSQKKPQRNKAWQPQKVLPLPQDVQDIVGDGSRCSNLGLWLDRYLTRKSNWELATDAKERKLVPQIIKQQTVNELVQAINKRYESLLAWYCRQGFTVRSFDAKPIWRFVIGLGAAHALETGITLHRIFGLPIIPASSLKGVARAYALLVESKSEHDPDLVAVFGTTKCAGSVIFLDAIPLETPRFTIDIMNPHYSKYYRMKGKKPPVDYELPKPVFFLTVEKTLYRFALATRVVNADELLACAERWLKGALSKLGIGAKTSADYGYWQI